MNDKELCAELRNRAVTIDGWLLPMTKKLCAEAADRLEVLLSTPEPSDDDLHGHEWRCDTCGERMRQGMSEVEVTRDELAKVIYEANTYSKPQWEYTLDSADRKITWAENAISDARNRADQALKEFRVSRRDGEDKNND